MIYTRTYTATDLDLALCTQCRGWCLPFPHKDSGTCSICYHAGERDAGRTDPDERPAPDATAPGDGHISTHAKN